MSILTRIVDLSKAVIHETLDKLEQPERMMGHYIRTMQEEVEELQLAANKEAANAAMQRRQADYFGALAAECERRALEAVAAERTLEARKALEAKLGYEERAAEHARALEQSQQRSAELAQRLAASSAECAAMLAKRDELAARAEKAQREAGVQPEAEARYASTAATGAAGLLHSQSGAALRGFKRMEERLQQKELQCELAQARAAADAAARSALVDEQLAKLLQEQAGGGAVAEPRL